MDIKVSEIRSELGVSQSDLTALLGISTRAIQSYEQQWRRPSDMVERLLLLLLIAHRNGDQLGRMKCWEKKACSPLIRKRCFAYRTGQGHLCWLFTGTLCAGKKIKNWKKKMELCQECSVMNELLVPKTR